MRTYAEVEQKLGEIGTREHTQGRTSDHVLVGTALLSIYAAILNNTLDEVHAAALAAKKGPWGTLSTKRRVRMGSLSLEVLWLANAFRRMEEPDIGEILDILQHTLGFGGCYLQRFERAIHPHAIGRALTLRSKQAVQASLDADFASMLVDQAEHLQR